VDIFTRWRRQRNAAPFPGFLSGTFLSKGTGLWLNRDFMSLWGAETVSQFGSQITPVAIPLLAALTLNASAFEMGILAASSGLPVLVIGFVAGAWLDALSITLFMIVSILTGMQTVVFNAAYSSLLPNLVERSELADANGKLVSSMSVSQVAGPALAGTLISLISAPIVILIDSLSFLLSGWFIGRIRHQEPRSPGPTGDAQFWREVREGLHALVSSPVLRAVTASSATINLAGFMFLSVYVLYMTDDLGLSATGVGLVYPSGGIGSLVGSVLTRLISARFGVGPSLVWSAVGFGAIGLTVPMAILVPEYALPLVIFAECMQWMTLIVFNVLKLSLRQSLTPDRLMGRVSASSQVLIGGMMPIGSVVGGAIGSLFGVHTALLVGCAEMFVAAAWVWWSPVIDIREMPTLPDQGLDAGPGAA